MKEKNAMECDASIYVESWFVLALSRIIVVFAVATGIVLLIAPPEDLQSLQRATATAVAQVAGKVGSTCWPQQTTHQRLFINGTLIYLVQGPTLGLIFGRCKSSESESLVSCKCCDKVGDLRKQKVGCTTA